LKLVRYKLHIDLDKFHIKSWALLTYFVCWGYQWNWNSLVIFKYPLMSLSVTFFYVELYFMITVQDLMVEERFKEFFKCLVLKRQLRVQIQKLLIDWRHWIEEIKEARKVSCIFCNISADFKGNSGTRWVDNSQHSGGDYRIVSHMRLDF